MVSMVPSPDRRPFSTRRCVPGNSAPMIIRAIAPLSVAFELLLAAGCDRRAAPPAPPPPAVTVARPMQQEVIEWDEYEGNLDAVESVDVRARVSGLITSAPFQEGAIVKQGDL